MTSRHSKPDQLETRMQPLGINNTILSGFFCSNIERPVASKKLRKKLEPGKPYKLWHFEPLERPQPKSDFIVFFEPPNNGRITKPNEIVQFEYLRFTSSPDANFSNKNCVPRCIDRSASFSRVGSNKRNFVDYWPASNPKPNRILYLPQFAVL